MIAGPGLQIRHPRGKWRAWRNDRPRTREPQKLTASHLYLWHKKIVVGRKVERFAKIHIELDFLASYRSIAACCLIWRWMDAVGLDRIEAGEGVAWDLCCEGEVA